MSRRRRNTDPLDAETHHIPQDRLFNPPPVPPPDFDSMIPPAGGQAQLALDMDAAVNAAAQTTVYDFDA